MWPFKQKPTVSEPAAEPPTHSFCRTCLTCAELAGQPRPEPAKQAAPEEPAALPSFAFDTAVGRVYSIEYAPETAQESLVRGYGQDKEYKQVERTDGRTTISYTVTRNADDKFSEDKDKEFVSVLTVEQHNEIVRQWLDGWKVLQWPRPAGKAP
jgi:hypothetical protein